MKFQKQTLLLLCALMTVSLPAHAALETLLASWLLGKAFDAAVAGSQNSRNGGGRTLSPENTEELAKLLNNELPQRTSDGLVMTMALSAGANTIELRHVSEKYESIEHLSARLDSTVAPSLLHGVCSDQAARMWLSAGGGFLFTFYVREGKLARSYSATSVDCK